MHTLYIYDHITPLIPISGSRMFISKYLAEAHKLYTRSICMSKKGSQNFALCFSNRSAVNYDLFLYQDCLDDIAIAFENS